LLAVQEVKMQQSIGLVTRISLVVTLVLLCFSLGCRQQAQVGLTEEEAQALFASYMEILNEGNLALADDVIDSHFVMHHCGLPEDLVGIEALKDFISNSLSPFPDFRMTIDDIIVKGDKVAWYWTAAATNTGPFGDLPPTGNKIELTGLGISRISNGKFAEEWFYYNVLGFYQQLGFTLVPPQVQK